MLEDGLAANSLAAYRRDLAALSHCCTPGAARRWSAAGAVDLLAYVRRAFRSRPPRPATAG
jgi:site-specific recombinase XerD